MNSRTIVCDSGPVLHLREAGALEMLADAGEIYIPPAVDEELSALVHDWYSSRPRWLKIDELNAEASLQAAQWNAAGLLHRGEAQAVALALQLRAGWFLTDDAAARVLAGAMKVETHGSLGVVLWSVGHGHMDRTAATHRLEALFQSSLWVSARVRQQARQALDQICSWSTSCRIAIGPLDFPQTASRWSGRISSASPEMRI